MYLLDLARHFDISRQGMGNSWQEAGDLLFLTYPWILFFLGPPVVPFFTLFFGGGVPLNWTTETSWYHLILASQIWRT